MKKITVLIMILLTISCKNNKNKPSFNEDGKKQISLIEIDSFLTSQAVKDSLNGVILIADNDEVLFKKAYGFKDLSHTEKHSLESKIGLASMPKMFTAIAIIKLAESGEIKLNNTVGNYLPEIKNQFLKDSVTIRQLLSHTSGLGNYWDYTNESDQKDLDKLYHLIVMNDSLKSHRKFRYSNSGFIVLGKIIESVSKVPYNEFVENNILTPLSMNNTQSVLPDGGSSSTVDDLMKFSKAIRNFELISKSDFDDMITKQSDANYGLGFQLNDKNDKEIYGHPGGYFEENTTLGVASAMDIIDNRYTVIVLTNRNPSMGGVNARNFILNDLTKQLSE